MPERASEQAHGPGGHEAQDAASRDRYRGPRPPQGRPGNAAGPGYAAGRFAHQGGGPVYTRRPPTQSLEGIALAEGEELVAGRRPVEEAFVARREARRLLVVPQRRMALEKLVLHATSLRIPVVEVEGGSLTAIAGFDGHQGIALVVAPRRWAAPDDILALARQRGQAPLVLVLDSLEDPQNVGTLLRTAEATGVHGAIFPTHRQAPLTPAAIKASAGAVEHLQLAPVDDLAGALADLHGRGLRIVGADGDAPLTAREADLRGPVAIVVGSEGRGLGPAVRRRCDLLVRIPMQGRIDSLNAAVAGSILLYEAAAQRGVEGERPAPASVVLGTGPGEDDERPTEADEPATDPPAPVEPEAAGAAETTPNRGPGTTPAGQRDGGRATPAASPDKASKDDKANSVEKPDKPAKRTRKPDKPVTKSDDVADTAAPPAQPPATGSTSGEKTKALVDAAPTTPAKPKRSRTPRAAVAASGSDTAPDGDDLLPGGPVVAVEPPPADPS
ncbi:MAG TPA: 23S rRNA (guanosine(2251)-2'-O)-methyltransferase RlmB [Candidatus Limnocylindrales bacterium]